MAFLSYAERYPLASFAVFFILVPLLSGLFRYAHLDEAFRLLLAFLIFDFLVGVCMMYLAAHRTNNILLLNLFVPVRYALLGRMLRSRIQSPKYRKALLFSIIGFIPFTLIDLYASNLNLSDLNNHRVGRYSQVVESILLILWVLVYFYEIIRDLDVTNITRYPFFWVCAGLLIFYSGNIFFFPLWHYMYQWEDDLQLGILEHFPYTVEIISLFLVSIGIWQIRPHDERTRS